MSSTTPIPITVRRGGTRHDFRCCMRHIHLTRVSGIHWNRIPLRNRRGASYTYVHGYVRVTRMTSRMELEQRMELESRM